MAETAQQEIKQHHYWQRLGKSKQKLPTPKGFLQLLLIEVAEKHSDSEANALSAFYGARETVSSARSRVKRLPAKVPRQQPQAKQYYKEHKKQITAIIQKMKGGE